jgi:hypothetical protein
VASATTKQANVLEQWMRCWRRARGVRMRSCSSPVLAQQPAKQVMPVHLTRPSLGEGRDIG